MRIDSANVKSCFISAKQLDFKYALKRAVILVLSIHLRVRYGENWRNQNCKRMFDDHDRDQPMSPHAQSSRCRT